jgi:hypothetical protein
MIKKIIIGLRVAVVLAITAAITAQILTAQISFWANILMLLMFFTVTFFVVRTMTKS